MGVKFRCINTLKFSNLVAKANVPQDPGSRDPLLQVWTSMVTPQTLFRYLEDEYSTHCPPSNISSGFASLPLPYVYTNGIANLSQPTTGRLPGGGKFNGKNAYLIMLSHFTTYNITPEEVDQQAEKKLKEIFPEVKYCMLSVEFCMCYSSNATISVIDVYSILAIEPFGFST